MKSLEQKDTRKTGIDSKPSVFIADRSETGRFHRQIMPEERA
jgi:hypothetical protein